MAELLGVVASGMGVVSLAFQLADSIKKLKDFHALMTDAPRDISLTLDEVEILTLVLQEIDRDLQKQLLLSPAIKAAAIKSLRLCNVSVEALSSLVGELEKGIMIGRKKGALKAASQKDKVEMFRKRLESTKLTMLVANQCYQGAVQRLNWESHEHDMLEIRMAISQITQSTMLGEISHTAQSRGNKKPDEVDNEHLVSSAASLPRNRRQLRPHKSTFKHVLRSGFLDVAIATHGATTTTSLSLRLPKWLCARRFNIDFRRSYHGWDQSIRTYKIIPSDALVIQYSINGNLAGLQDLFSTGLASPFEVNVSGATPLHYAALYAQAETCRFLLTCGADVNARTYDDDPFYSGKIWHCVPRDVLRGEYFYDVNWLQRSTPLHHLAYGGASVRAFHERNINDSRVTSYRSFDNDIHATTEVLYLEGGSDPFQEASGKNTVLDVWHGPLETFRWLRKQEHIQFQSLSPKELTDLGFTHMLSFEERTIEIVREIIPKANFASLFPSDKDVHSWSNFLTMAIENRELAPCASSLRQEWTDLLDELVCIGFQRRFLDRLPIQCYYPTAFLQVISTLILPSLSLPSWYLRLTVVKRIVIEWLMNVVNAGVDLLSYGQKELSRLTNISSSQLQNTLWTFQYDIGRTHSLGLDYCSIYLIQLRIGARPEEWDLEFEDLYVSASLARYFWILVDGTNKQKATLAQTDHFKPIEDEVFDELEYEEDMAIPGSWCD